MPASVSAETSTITHREMRNNSAGVLARVAAGEELMVTNHGEPAAYLVPVAMSARRRLIASGRLTERTSRLDVDRLAPPIACAADTAAAVDDDRGDL